MTDPLTYDPDELLDLAADECDGDLTPERFERLEQLIANIPEARRAYLRYRRMQADLATADQTILTAGWAERLAGSIAESGAPLIERDEIEDEEPREVIVHPLRRIPAGAWAVAAALIVAAPLMMIALKSAAPIDDPPPDDPKPRPLYGTFSITSRQLSGELESGVRIVATPPTDLRIESGFDAVLLSGVLEAEVPPEAVGFVVTTPSVRIRDLGTRFRAAIDDQGRTIVEVLEGHVAVQPRHKTPKFYLDFNGSGDHVINRMTGATYPLNAGTTRVDGPVGGALRFDNSARAGVNLGPTGFDAKRGMTIEAVVVVEWSGKPGDYDEVFRKENADRRLILLAFQNDAGPVPARPAPVKNQPCLAFGLALEEFGYEELDLPLDGKDGRPTFDELRDGKPHHLAATYNADTGVKAIYIDGRRVMQVVYPTGREIVSSGNAPAMVGNIIPDGREPFTGVIDEFAFYDFTVSAPQIMDHAEAIRDGRHYYAAPPYDQPDEEANQIVLSTGESAVFDEILGLALRRDASKTTDLTDASAPTADEPGAAE